MVDSVNNGLSNQNAYDDGDIDSLKGREGTTTSAALNVIGNHAGLGDTHVIQGRDKTSNEIVAEHQDAVRKEWTPGGGDAAAAGAGKVIEHIAAQSTHFAIRAAGGLMLPLHVLELAKKMASSVAEDSNVGHERAEAQVKSALHLMVIGSLNGLPQSYVTAQRARYAADAPSGLTQRMTQALGRGDNGLMAIAQLHCDQGMNAARGMVAADQTQDAFLAAHPDVAKRCNDDAAYRAGFEGMAQARGSADYDAMTTALDAREKRYDAHQVAWRG
jgi:hypothetical protein